MKVNSQQTGTGRLGASVYSVNSGVCITRSYREHITNPNTPAQVAQRARMKLMTQLAAAMAPVIAIPKNGLVSGRNQFISTNFPYSSANEEAASCEFEKLQLTKATNGLPALYASRAGNQSPILVNVKEAANLSCDRVIYILFAKNAENKLQYIASVVSNDPSGDGSFEAELPACTTDCVIYAYGMKDASAAASAKYGNYSVSSGADVAQLIMTRKLAASDYRLTKTQGVMLYSEQDDSEEWHNPFPGASIMINGAIKQIEEEISMESGENNIQIQPFSENSIIKVISEDGSEYGNPTYDADGIWDIQDDFDLSVVIVINGKEWVKLVVS